jgi:hypothetical protein
LITKLHIRKLKKKKKRLKIFPIKLDHYTRIMAEVETASFSYPKRSILKVVYAE